MAPGSARRTFALGGPWGPGLNPHTALEPEARGYTLIISVACPGTQSTRRQSKTIHPYSSSTNWSKTWWSSFNWCKQKQGGLWRAHPTPLRQHQPPRSPQPMPRHAHPFATTTRGSQWPPRGADGAAVDARSKAILGIPSWIQPHHRPGPLPVVVEAVVGNPHAAKLLAQTLQHIKEGKQQTPRTGTPAGLEAGNPALTARGRGYQRTGLPKPAPTAQTTHSGWQTHDQLDNNLHTYEEPKPSSSHNVECGLRSFSSKQTKRSGAKVPWGLP